MRSCVVFFVFDDNDDALPGALWLMLMITMIDRYDTKGRESELAPPEEYTRQTLDARCQSGTWTQHSRMPPERTPVTLERVLALKQHEAISQRCVELWVSKKQAAGGHLEETPLGHDMGAVVRGVPSFGRIECSCN